jgi:hypothetical protein
MADKCDSPTLRDESVIISGIIEGPILGGSTIAYSCSIGQTLTGFNSSTCMDNGHWEPDPMDTSCTGNYRITSMELMFDSMYPQFPPCSACIIFY